MGIKFFGKFSSEEKKEKTNSGKNDAYRKVLLGIPFYKCIYSKKNSGK